MANNITWKMDKSGNLFWVQFKWEIKMNIFFILLSIINYNFKFLTPLRL